MSSISLDWDGMGLLYDDLWTPATQGPDPCVVTFTCRARAAHEVAAKVGHHLMYSLGKCPTKEISL